jgi:RNA polymerase sigma-70 factor (ECF subfamily)
MALSDRELLQEIAAGDEAALAEFYDRFASYILALLVRWTGRRGDADDVLQEVFWQVWRQASSYDEHRATPRGWLVLLAQSRAVDVLRKRKAAAAITVETEPSTTAGPLADAQLTESRDRVWAALERLPQEQQSAICSAFFDGLTYQQVAERENIPEGTAKTRIRLGLQRLRSYLNDEGNS